MTYKNPPFNVQPINKRQRFDFIKKYLIKHEKITLGAIMFTLCLAFLAYSYLPNKLDSSNTQILSLLPAPFTLMDLASVISLVLVIMLWFGSINERSRDTLPNYLTVNAYHNGRISAQIKYAKLADPADIRPHAISLLQALNNHKRVNLSPVLTEIKSETISIDSTGHINKGKPFESFEVSIELLSPLCQQAVLNEYQDLPMHSQIIWQHPLKEEDKTVIEDNNTTKPLSSYKR